MKVQSNKLCKGSLVGVAIGTMLWISLLTVASLRVQEQQAVQYDVTIGPLLLNTLTKTTEPDSTKAAIIFDNGLLLYFGAWILLGAVIALLWRPIANTTKN